MSKKLDWNELLAHDRLWPEYKNERNDMILWEKFDPSEDEWLGWHLLTDELITQAESWLRQIGSG